ncbi:uncharacterized protein LOC141524030 [Cotesia typhae]|uniref:uncharacterized protein LOC141524030 n=1 Tax=Cotesia typhae TaxID=2053667 RepID=UPI003D69D21D
MERIAEENKKKREEIIKELEMKIREENNLRQLKCRQCEDNKDRERNARQTLREEKRKWETEKEELLQRSYRHDDILEGMEKEQRRLKRVIKEQEEIIKEKSKYRNEDYMSEEVSRGVVEIRKITEKEVKKNK